MPTLRQNIRYGHLPTKPRGKQPFLRLICFAAVLALGTATGSATADEITDFSGLNVELAVDVTADGGRSFFATLMGNNTATIGAGHEFTLNVGASGFSTRPVRIDFDSNGLVNAYADSQFAIGNTSFSAFSFDITFSLLDAEITSAISQGDLVRGDAVANGIDPVVWSFSNENDNSFGRIMTFGGIGGTTPKVQLSANAIPEPTTGAVCGLASLALLFRRRRRVCSEKCGH